MKTEIQFLRETAEKLKQRRYEHDLPMAAWKETIFCQVEFLVTADEIENHYRPPRAERVIVEPLPKVRAPRERLVLVERRFPQLEKEIIVPPFAPSPIEKQKSTVVKLALKTKDLTFRGALKTKDLELRKSANVLRGEEKAPKVEITPNPLKTKSNSIRKPNRAPQQVKKEEEINLDRLVKFQRGRCAYCFHSFGDRIFLKRKIIVLHATREHFIPESMGRQIIFAACQMCNIFKRDYLFNSISKCRKYLAGAWERSGYQDAKGHFLADSQMFSKN